MGLTDNLKKVCFLAIFILLSASAVSTYLYSTSVAAKSRTLVGAFYYVWYGETRHWNSSSDSVVVDEPNTKYYQGYYSSMNGTLIRDQLELIKAAGIDFVIISWFGINTYEDNATRLVFETMKEQNIQLKAAVMVEPVQDYDVNVTKLTEVKNYIMQNYVQQYKEQYLYWDNKPLLAFFVPLNPPRDKDFSFRIVGGQPYADWPYWNVPPSISSEGVVSVIPRYDDSRLSRELKMPVRDSGYTEGLYDQQWTFILENMDKLKAVLITTWNEYHERTAIEPHVDATAKIANYGPDYLYQKTQTYIRQLKNEQTSVTPYYQFLTLPLLVLIVYQVANISKSNADKDDRQNIKELLTIGLSSRFIIIFIAFVANSTFGLRTPFQGEILTDYKVPLLNLFARWDSTYYLDIAKAGYSTSAQWAFRPLFPFIMNSLNFLFTASPPAAVSDLIPIGFFLNNFLFLLSLPLFYKVASRFLNKANSFTASILFAFFPTTFIMSSIYPEALSIVLILIGYFYLEEKRILTSSLFVFLAGLSRPEVFIASVIYLVKGYLEKKSMLRYLVASFVAFSSLISFMVYSFLSTGDFMTPFKANALWGVKSMPDMILSINRLQPNLNPDFSLVYFVLNLPLYALLLAILAYYYLDSILSYSRRVDTLRNEFPYVLHSTLLFGLISIAVPYLSSARLALSTFPLLWVLSMLCRDRKLLYLVLLQNIVLLTMYLSLHVNWYHVT